MFTTRRTTRFIAAAACAAFWLHAGTADAKHRVVVLDFDGPDKLSELGRNTVVVLLNREHAVISANEWEEARGAASGSQEWQHAARQTGVDAVITGVVHASHHRHVLTIAVHEAATGKQLDSLSVNIDKKGVDLADSLLGRIDVILDRIPGDTATRPSAPRDSGRLNLGTSEREEPIATHEVASTPEAKPSSPVIAADAAPDSSAPASTSTTPARPTVVATVDEPAAPVGAAPPVDTISSSKLAESLRRTTKPTPRFEFAGGAFVQSRGLTFDYDTVNSIGGPPAYPASGLQGFALSAAIYPLPPANANGKMSGIGFSFNLAKSVGATLDAQDDYGYGTYAIEHLALEAAVHYRFPWDKVALDTQIIYGHSEHIIPDLPQSIEVPDVSYNYLGVGAHADFYVTERAYIGVGARYMWIYDAGDVQSQDWYGGGSAWGVALDASFTVPLPSRLFLRGGLEWRHIEVNFDGTGLLSDQWGVGTMTDTAITGSALVGVQF